MARTGRRRGPGFTLVELLVVIVIVLLVSAVTIPAILPAISHRQVSETARILQAQLVQARDTAIRYNAPRGVRFLPDPTYNKAGTTIVAYNRMVNLEPAPEYTNGLVTIWPAPAAFNVVTMTWQAQPWATGTYPDPFGGTYPYYPPGSTPNPLVAGYAGRVLMVEQAPFANNDTTPNAGTGAPVFNAPTSWFWNIRIGDQIQLAGSGQTYTVVGPCTVNPLTGAGANPELFVNVGQPGDTGTAAAPKYLFRNYTAPGATNPVQVPTEFLFLVNGVDDDGDGFVDEGFDGVDNNDQMLVGGAWQKYGYNGLTDDPGDNTNFTTEWEPEKFLGVVAGKIPNLPPMTTNLDTTQAANLPAPMSYTITRRPVPSQSAREVMFPSNVVVDATTITTTQERSRLPTFDPLSGLTDVVILPSGQVVPQTTYSVPTSFSMADSFYHFWLAERSDVHEATELWGPGNPNPNAGLKFVLPMPQDAYTAYTNAGNAFGTRQPQIALTGDRMLVTLFSRTGQITTNSVEFFNCADVGTPFYDSQLGAREAK